MQTLMRLQVHGKTMRELIGMPVDMTFAEAEAVQGMVVWADQAAHPLAPPELATDAARPAVDIPETLPRTPLAPAVTGYGSVLAAHEDCVAPGVAVREIRPPLTELNPLSKDYPPFAVLKPEPLDSQTLLGKLLLTRGSCERFTQVPISRDDLWWVNRLAFRGGSNYPLFPDGPHSALVRPFWIVCNVTGVENAIWYYNPMHDNFSMVKRGVFRAQALKLHLDHPACENAAAICIMVANLHRLMTDGGPDLYRLAHLEAGVASQRLFVAANALGLSVNVNGEFYDQDLRALLGVEKTGWEPICSAAIGETAALPG